jgi:hypothetical protein
VDFSIGLIAGLLCEENRLASLQAGLFVLTIHFWHWRTPELNQPLKAP